MRFNEHTYSDNAELQNTNSNNIGREAFRKRAQQEQSPMFAASLDAIDAGVALLAEYQFGQALVMFTQAIEVACKAVIEDQDTENHNAWLRRHPKALAQTAGSKSTIDMKISEDVRQLSFKKAFDTTCTRLNLNGSHSFYRVRNRVVHEGVCEQRSAEYFRLIANEQLPFIEELFELVIDQQISEYLDPVIAREIIVAEKYLREVNHQLKYLVAAVEPLRCAYTKLRHPNRGMPNGSVDHCGEIHFGCAELENEASWKDWLAGQLEGGEKLGVGSCIELVCFCKICGEQIILGTDFRRHEEKSGYVIESLACTNCGLFLSSNCKELIEIHYGTINKDLIGAEDWNQLITELED